MSHTVRTMKRKNCRYSDCQFSATSTANWEDVTYWPKFRDGICSAAASSL